MMSQTLVQTERTPYFEMSEEALAFRMTMDRPGDAYAIKQYFHGLEIGQTYNEFHIAINNAWSASDKRRNCFSYEKLGYHRATAELFQGILDSGIKIIDHRH